MSRIRKTRAAYAEMARSPARQGANAIGVRLSTPRAGDLTLLLRRAPVPGDDRPGSDGPVHHRRHDDRPVWPEPADEHLVAGAGETESSWLAAADVILRSRGGPPPHTIADVFARFPGCLVAALAVHGPVGDQGTHGGGAVIGTVTGDAARLEPLYARAWRDEDLWPYASAVHAWLIAGRPFAALHHAGIIVPRGGPVAERGVRLNMIGQERERFPAWEGWKAWKAGA